MVIFQLKSRFEHQGKGKGYERTYYINDDAGQMHWSFDVYGQLLKAPTEYRLSTDRQQDFRMKALRKVLNFTYVVEDGNGECLAAITHKGVGFRWKILGPDDRELARIIDPAGKTEKVFSTLFAALPDGYAVVCGDQPVAQIQSEQLTRANRVKPGNLLGKLLDKVVFLNKGLTLRIDPDFQSMVDTRVLLAGMTLLEVHDIDGTLRNA